MDQLELVFQLLVRLQFMYLQYNVYLNEQLENLIIDSCTQAQYKRGVAVPEGSNFSFLTERCQR